jgi:ABC-type transporter Mla maintaining outer membrane lipid asymmetry ATPase subunit MlaF
MSPALALSVDGAVPLEFRDIDLRDRPDHPDNKFNLTLLPGETIAAVGDEDSGVGDLGRFALGLMTPISGTAYVFGKVIASLPYYDLLVFRRRLGYLQTGDGLLQNLTLRDNIALPLRYASDHRASEVDGRVAELIAEFDLERVALLRPAAANEEDRRRCALARAVALDPDLLVLEAPFDGLTQATAVELLGLANARADGTERSVLITAQDLAPALRPLLTRVVRVTEGMAVNETT